jgi:hypothetical protein
MLSSITPMKIFHANDVERGNFQQLKKDNIA